MLLLAHIIVYDDDVVSQLICKNTKIFIMEMETVAVGYLKANHHTILIVILPYSSSASSTQHHHHHSSFYRFIFKMYGKRSNLFMASFKMHRQATWNSSEKINFVKTKKHRVRKQFMTFHKESHIYCWQCMMSFIMWTRY